MTVLMRIPKLIYKLFNMRKFVPSQIHDLYLSAEYLTDDPSKVFTYMNQGEFDLQSGGSQIYPSFYGINENTQNLLRILINKINPKVVVETGVANGVSTKIFLEAMPKGVVHSFDINEDVAISALKKYKNWKFNLIRNRFDFKETIESIEKIDIFFYDSDHCYSNQMFEYDTVWDRISKKGLLISDGVN